MRGRLLNGMLGLALCVGAVSAQDAPPETALPPEVSESTARMLAEALRAAHAGPSSLIRVSLETDTPIVLAGREVWVRFSVTNLTDQLVTLRVPEVDPAPAAAPSMGLPHAHVFSGENFSSLAILDKYGDIFGRDVSVPPSGEATEVQLAPRGSIGLTVELTRHYPILRRNGVFTLTWRPYDGQVVSEPLTITILAEQEATILTDFGKMRMRFYYDKAPRHVANFVELINMRFYDQLTFNRIVSGGILQGGGPRGDRRGVRPDGKRLKAEFSDIPFERGTAGMARSMQDPDSASCQFFITLSRQPSFDGKQTAFAYLVGEESFQTLDKIAAVPTDATDRPTQPVYIRTISLENIPPKGWDVPDAPASGVPGRSPATQPASAMGPALSGDPPPTSARSTEQPRAQERP